MPKPPFVPKEDVEAFIRIFVAENKKLPTTAEMRAHFQGGSMNRYSAILRDMNLSKPQKERPMKLDYTEEQTLLSAVSAIFEKKLEAEVAKKTQSESELRSAALEDLADEKEKVEALEAQLREEKELFEEKLSEKEALFEQRLQERDAKFIQELQAISQKAAEEKVRLETELTALCSEIEQVRSANEALQTSGAFFKVLEKFSGRKLVNGDLQKVKAFLSKQERNGHYFSRCFEES